MIKLENQVFLGIHTEQTFIGYFENNGAINPNIEASYFLPGGFYIGTFSLTNNNKKIFNGFLLLNSQNSQQRPDFELINNLLKEAATQLHFSQTAQSIEYILKARRIYEAAFFVECENNDYQKYVKFQEVRQYFFELMTMTGAVPGAAARYTQIDNINTDLYNSWI